MSVIRRRYWYFRLWRATYRALLRVRPLPGLVATHVNPSIDQNRFRGREDDGSESTATWIAAENTNWTQDVDVNFRIRITLQETAGAGVGCAPKLQYNLNSAGWNDVNASSSVARSSGSSNLTDSDPTTHQCGGTGTFTAGFVDDVSGSDSPATIALSASGHTEVEFCLQLRSADVADNDTVQFRIINDAGSLMNAYSQIPSVTVNESTSTVLVIADALHSHTADNLALTQHNILAINDALHAHATDNVALGLDLIIQDALHGHTADGLSLIQHHVLAIADALHGHTVDSLALTQHNILAIQDALHGHTADNLALVQHHILAIADALHGHAAENVVLSLGGSVALVIQDGTHAHTADGLVLGVGLVIADATHDHSAEELALTQHNILAIHDALHAQTADNVVLSIPGEEPDEQPYVIKMRRRRMIGSV